jgi:predicted alpha-1,2-mannosidase
MKKNILYAVFVLLFGVFSSVYAQDSTESFFVQNPVDLVNPFIGTAPLLDTAIIGYTPPRDWRVWAGLTYPGATLPNAMVQLSPITEYHTGAGYQYEDTTILGFTHTNKGHWNLCNIPILPVSGNAEYPYKSTFSHDREKASPDFYQVYLSDYDVDVRLTTTLRCGIHEYTFKNPDDRRILFDLAKANNNVSGWELNKINDREVSGFQQMGDEKIYFFAQLNTDIKSIDNKPGKDGYALLHLAQSENNPVVLKIGLSFVSAANAKENLQKEVGDSTLDEVHQEGVAVWQDLLNQVKIKGGTPKEQELFYSSLYRSVQWPALRSDANGDFMDDAGKVRNEDFEYYTNPSLWDTFRNKLVLLGMLRPKVTGDIIQSLVTRGEISGFMPTFFHGDHAAAFVASSYLRGIDNFDVKKAYEFLLNNAYKEGGTRPHIKEYIEKGYISEPDIKEPNTETKANAGVSKTLEFAYDDYALAQLAKALGDQEHYKDLMKRSQNFKNMFDPKTHFMRGRLENGDWITPFNPQYPYYEYMYREANAWQVSFFAPQDMPGLVKLYGGEKPFEQKLDSLFSLKWNPNYIARNVSGFLGQYAQGNQPDHEAPFSYYFVDKPEKSQKVIDTLLKNYYGIGESGNALSGMDDAGEMSAWYVFGSSGLYPLSTADNQLLVTLPVFDEVKWDLTGKKEVLIKKEGDSRNLKAIEFNGKPVDGYFVSQKIFENGGPLDLITQ